MTTSDGPVGRDPFQRTRVVVPGNTWGGQRVRACSGIGPFAFHALQKIVMTIPMIVQPATAFTLSIHHSENDRIPKA